MAPKHASVSLPRPLKPERLLQGARIVLHDGRRTRRVSTRMFLDARRQPRRPERGAGSKAPYGRVWSVTFGGMALCAAAAWPTFIFHGKVFAAVQTAWGLVCLAFLVGFIWSWIHYRQTFKTLRGLSDTQIHIKTTATTGRHVAKHARK